MLAKDQAGRYSPPRLLSSIEEKSQRFLYAFLARNQLSIATMTTTVSEHKLYELLLILPPDISEKDFQETLEEIKKHIAENARGVKFEDKWGLRHFSYRLKKYDEGYYAVLYFEAEPSDIAEIRTTVKLHPRVLRHLLMTLPPKYEPKSLQDLELMTPQITRETKVSGKKKPLKKQETKEAVAEIMEAPLGEEAKKPLLSGKTEEEKLKSLDKTLESILDNPDIEVK